MPECVSVWLCIHWGQGNCFYWLGQQQIRPSIQLGETQVTPLLPGIYGISFHWLFRKFWHLEEAEWETCYSVMMKLFDLVSKFLQSPLHLVALLLLMIILGPSGVLLCPKHRVLFRTNHLTWQGCWTDLLSLGWALCSCWRRPMRMSGGADISSQQDHSFSLWATQDHTPGLGWLKPVFLPVRALCHSQAVGHARALLSQSSSTAERQDSRWDGSSVGPSCLFLYFLTVKKPLWI